MKVADVSRILCVRADGIGDLLNSTPAISWLRRSYPDAHVTCLASPLASPLLHANPDVDEIWVLPRASFQRWIACRSRIRQGHFDLAVAFQTSSLCHWLVGSSRARYRVGRYEKRFRGWLNHPCHRRYRKGEVHEIERNLDLVRAFCIGPPPDSPRLVLQSEEIRQAEEKMRAIVLRELQARLGEIAPILIHPGGSSEDKRWPAESFAAIARRLRGQGHCVILVHGPGEEALANAVRSGCPLPVIEPRSLRELAGLLRMAGLFICNDSGPMHVASALNVPTIAIFGPTDHVRWGPKGVRIVRREMACWPCSAHQCPFGHACIKELDLELVWQAVEELHVASLSPPLFCQ